MNQMAGKTADAPSIEETTSVGAGREFEAEVIVFNCDCHTYQEVIMLFCQIIPNMTPSKAFELAWQIDHQGSAVVFQGDIKQAKHIGGKLAQGGLRIEIRH